MWTSGGTTRQSSSRPPSLDMWACWPGSSLWALFHQHLTLYTGPCNKHLHKRKEKKNTYLFLRTFRRSFTVFRPGFKPTFFVIFLQHVFTLTMNERFSLDGGYIGELLFVSFSFCKLPHYRLLLKWLLLLSNWCTFHASLFCNQESWSGFLGRERACGWASWHAPSWRMPPGNCFHTIHA